MAEGKAELKSEKIGARKIDKVERNNRGEGGGGNEGKKGGR